MYAFLISGTQKDAAGGVKFSFGEACGKGAAAMSTLMRSSVTRNSAHFKGHTVWVAVVFDHVDAACRTFQGTVVGTAFHLAGADTGANIGNSPSVGTRQIGIAGRAWVLRSTDSNCQGVARFMFVISTVDQVTRHDRYHFRFHHFLLSTAPLPA